MPKVTPEEFVKDWSKNLKGSTDKIKRQVDKVKEAPSQKAIDKKELMKAKLIQAIEDGTWENMLGKYTLQQWKDDMKNKGVGRISKGVDGAKDKMEEFAKWLLAREAEIQAEIEDMPKETIDDSVARAEKWIRDMAEKKYKRGD